MSGAVDRNRRNGPANVKAFSLTKTKMNSKESRRLSRSPEAVQALVKLLGSGWIVEHNSRDFRGWRATLTHANKRLNVEFELGLSVYCETHGEQIWPVPGATEDAGLEAIATCILKHTGNHQ